MQYLCDLGDIPNHQSKGFEVGEQKIFVVRKNDKVYAYHNSCPHLGIALEWLPDKFLDMDGELIQCSTHGALFTIEDGHCITGPCSGQHLTHINTQVQNEQVLIHMPS